MTFPLVQFVSSPDDTATVRFDFNTAGDWSDDKTWPKHDGWSLGAPSLQGDPDGIGTEYGFRELSFNLLVQGTPGDASRQMSALARELQRQANWLRFQFSPGSDPVWFKTYRSAPAALDFEQVYGADDSTVNTWGIGIKLDADAFAYGALITLPGVTVNNDPAAPTNPCSYLLPPVAGDVPTPIKLDITPSVLWADSRVLTAVAAHDASVTPAPIVWQSGGFISGIDTTAATADSSMSGGSRSTVTFATNASLTTRLAGPAPSTPNPGRYKVLCRIVRAVNGDTFALRLGQRYGTAATLWGDTVNMNRGTSPTSTYGTYVDLGDFTFPLGGDGWSITDPTLAPAPQIDLQIWRTGGTGSLYVDAFVLIPIDTSSTVQVTTLTTWFKDVDWQASRRAVWDGDAARFRAVDGGIFANSVAPILGAGDFLEVVPGANNMLHLHHQVDTTVPATSQDNTDAISTTAAVSISYRPRWLYLAGG